MRRTCSAAFKPSNCQCQDSKQGVSKLALLVLLVLEMPNDLTEKSTVLITELLVCSHDGFASLVVRRAQSAKQKCVLQKRIGDRPGAVNRQ